MANFSHNSIQRPRRISGHFIFEYLLLEASNRIII